ncbi:DUF4249 domain-containing protein [Spirosoma oryzicola]|uniref:DUF4249 domain-containing protein n=1 Tax=Spirosoma oryzicola TaxID=2898794 RepID=UPI001E4DF57F|nr:DUF4249 domain-containing protein [Spirosoma oryzicola]UHG91639.1 DUF4249 domain-containing protein [Spirosoma oryzicola]
MRTKLFFVFTILIGLTGLLTGCDSLRNEVDPSVLGAESPRLVVHGFLSPQSRVLAVRVTRSQTVVGDSVGGAVTIDDSLADEADDVVDAVVTISEGGRSVNLRYKANGLPYYSARAGELLITVGKTYTLTVQTPNGERATSSCTIPGPVDLTSIRFDSLQSGRIQRYFVRARWYDVANQTNYYQVTGAFRFIADCPECTTKPGYIEREEFSNLSFDDNSRGLLTDADGNDEMISGRAYLNGANVDTQLPFRRQYKTATVTMNLLNIEPSYYQYWTAVIRQRRTRGNPFAEPVMIPSNIQGGLGCFAGYSNSTLTLRIK